MYRFINHIKHIADMSSVKVPNRGFTSFIGLYKLDNVLASQRVLCVGEYFSIKPKKEELKQILISYDRKKSEDSGIFTLSYSSNTIEMTKEDAKAFVTPLGKEVVNQLDLLGYDGLISVGRIAERPSFEYNKEDDEQQFIEDVVNISFCDIENTIRIKNGGESEELERFYKVTSNLIKAIKKRDGDKVVICLGELEIMELNAYYDNSIGEEENMEDSFERKFYRSVCFYTLIATMKIFTSKVNMKKVKTIEYTGKEQKYIQVFFAGISLL